MAIGFSDGTMAEDWGQYFTQGTSQGSVKETATAHSEDPGDRRQNQGTRNEFNRNLVPNPTDDSPAYDQLNPAMDPNMPSILPVDTPKFNNQNDITDPKNWDLIVDKEHHVPLVATALTKDGQNMYGMAVDHRVPLQMSFNGSNHDITPFLYAHEQAELPVMHDLIQGGMDVQEAYHQAHDKVANPTEAATRFAYAAKNGLDPDEFNKAYYNHIQQATNIASQPSDQPRHPDAHTTKYGLDETELGQKYAMNEKPLQMDVLGTQLFQAGGVHPGPGVIGRTANDEIENFDAIPKGSTWFDKAGIRVKKLLSTEELAARAKNRKVIFETKPLTKSKDDE